MLVALMRPSGGEEKEAGWCEVTLLGRGRARKWLRPRIRSLSVCWVFLGLFFRTILSWRELN